MSAWLLLGGLFICILWQELSHWPSMFSRESPSTGQSHAGLIGNRPAINQQEQCIMEVGGNSCLKIVEVLRPFLAEWACAVGLLHTDTDYRLKIQFFYKDQNDYHRQLLFDKVCQPLPLIMRSMY